MRHPLYRRHYRLEFVAEYLQVTLRLLAQYRVPVCPSLWRIHGHLHVLWQVHSVCV